MTKKIKIALGLLGGIALASAIAPIVVSCSNDNGPNNNGNPNGPNLNDKPNGPNGGDTGGGNDSLDPPVAVDPNYYPTEEAKKIIPRKKFDRIEKNLDNTRVFLNKSNRTQKFFVNEFYLRENKFYFSLIDLNSNNVLGSFDCNLSPNAENKYTTTFITSNIATNEMNNQEPQPHTINLTWDQLDLLLFYYENNSTLNAPIFDNIDPNWKSYSKELNQVTKNIIEIINSIKGWAFNDVFIQFYQSTVAIRFNLYDDNLRVYKSNAYFFVEDKTTSTWKLDYLNAEGIVNSPANKEEKITKQLTKEQVVAFFKEIYTNKRIPSIVEIGKI